jgi:pyridoxal phosphate enzyme (YggS family)
MSAGAGQKNLYKNDFLRIIRADMSIADNLATVQEKIERIAKKCGREKGSIRLIAVSKTHSVEQILEAARAGQLAFGENYAQELRDKSKQIAELLATSHQTLATDLEWHYIGHLQKNKIKYVAPVANWIHTIDSIELLKAVSERPANNDKRPINCLIEVNIAGEASKSGVSPENIFSLVRVFSETYTPKHSGTQALSLKGLMCMPPVSDDAETSRPYFRQLKSLLDEINSRSIYPEKLTELSMGMSQDFEVAIEEGSTMVRIGSAIFGERSA